MPPVSSTEGGAGAGEGAGVTLAAAEELGQQRALEMPEGEQRTVRR